MDLFKKGIRLVARLQKNLERSLRKYAGPLYRLLQRYSGQRLVKRFAHSEDRFRHFYETNHWSEIESVSGPGSTLEETNSLRESLRKMLYELEVKTLLDLPCGDFHWMQHVDLSEINYIGGDLVSELVERNQSKYARERVGFKKINLLKDSLPTADFVLCRDCLVHMSFDDVQAAFINISRSDVKWLLTTNFPDVKRNNDIVTGQWRPINLMLPPFNLPYPTDVINENKCSWISPQQVPEGDINSYYTYGVKFEHPEVSWSQFRQKHISNGGDGIFAAWSLLYNEDSIPDVLKRLNSIGLEDRLNHRKGICPNAETIQKKIMQFTTNQKNEDEMKIQADALNNTIKHFS